MISYTKTARSGRTLEPRKDAANLDEFYVLKEGDCAYYPTGWKYKVKNTGSSPGKFFYYMSSPRHGVQRLDKPS